MSLLAKARQLIARSKRKERHPRDKDATPQLSGASNLPNTTGYVDVSGYEPERSEMGRARFCTVERLAIDVDDDAVPGFLHLPFEYSITESDGAAVILLSGAGGGVAGPSGMYVSLADTLANLSNGIPVLRLDYRIPAVTEPCSKDVLAAMDYLQGRYRITKFVLVGWSFGGAPVFTVAAQEQVRVIACATIASQTRAAGGIRHLAPRPVLLLHGSNDQTLNVKCSQGLYKAYGDQGDCTLQVFEGDDHSLTHNSRVAQSRLCEFIVRCVAIDMDDDDRTAIAFQEPPK